jgi:DNA-binding transcriptional LysR family regulator
MKITNLDDLHIFRTVALDGGVLRAAALLNRVSSNVTRRIKQFEDRLGSKLFRRHRRKSTQRSRPAFDVMEVR